ncbi:hypothetical protein jhhlp_006914 [Lomentospora prolificans]|uniref:Uncharacterized protein n=1 Tax=Lomentospora prolificans TaxID=41688 RepID=A0A2N3N340_9PEZI|nr:hypothetical protein jhhlp_006914 [Lomentospora prolificans]
MSDVFRRVGRGGAGNFISPSATDTAEDPARDVEAQKLPPVPVAPAAQQHQPYARVGRGGAGNFHDAADAPEETQEQVAARTDTTMAASASGPRTGLMGRGGMGNWSDAPSQQQQEAEKQKQAVVEKQVVQDVDAGLKAPAKAYDPNGSETERN